MAGMPTDPPLVLDVDGVQHHVRHARASWWIPYLSTGNWFGLLTDAAPALMDRMWDSEDAFDMDDAARLTIQLVEGVCGMPWPRAIRLAAQADATWDRLESWAVTNAGGLDLMTAPPRRTLAVVQAMLFATCEKESEIDALMRKLDDTLGIPGYTRTARRAAYTVDAAAMAELTSGPMLLGKGG